MQRLTGRDMWDVEECQSPRMGSVILGVGGTSNTVCVCIPAAMPFNDPLPVLSRTVAGYSNHNSVGEDRARETLERVMSQALLKARRRRSNVCAVCLAVAGVNHPVDQQRMLDWLRSV
uniref:Actin-like ATPase superfamily protein n=1 Tax=Zea mays TaxID=4577 RepID=A0A804M4F3_MAIZE